MSSPSWTPPHWSHPPTHENQWNLLEIKQGNLITTHPINSLASKRKGCITFGRMDDPSIVDVVTLHESCSRLHARLAFDSAGVPWLKDMGSNNGTFINHLRLPREACGKIEPTKGSKDDGMRGSRGVVVYPGDVLKFGASTRIFCLEGPEEFDRGNKRVKSNDMNIAAADDKKSYGANESGEKQETVVECSWGMGQDAECEDDIHQPTARGSDPNLPSIETFFSSSQYKIPSSLQQLYKTHQTKSFKLQSIQVECQRIMQKEDRGAELTDGQTKQLEKNRERIEGLEKDLEDLTARIEDGIYSVVHGVDVNVRKRRVQRSVKEDDDVDYFYDRTAVKKQRREEDDEVQSEESLIQKWKSLHKSRAKQLEVVSCASRKCQEIQKEIDLIEDEEEAFFLRNDLSLANEELGKTKDTLENMEKEWSEAEYLLKVVNPKLAWDREVGWINAAKGDETMMMPPPPKSCVPLTDPYLPQPDQLPMMPPPAPLPSNAARVIGPAMLPPAHVESQSSTQSAAAQQSDHDTPKTGKTKHKIGPGVGTLAALQQAVNATSQAPKDKSNPSRQNDDVAAPTFDPCEDTWSAPKDQDGSGRTSLHDKFKGRY
jgi:pSer/pThr/pTyr-binding forkhead associated (FHA) protein